MNLKNCYKRKKKRKLFNNTKSQFSVIERGLIMGAWAGCKGCNYGKEVTEQGKHWGWACHHPNIKNQHGLMYGRYHQLENRKPKWCPANDNYVQLCTARRINDGS